MPKVVLASASASRIALFRNAGLEFAARPAAIDERSVEAPLVAAGAAPSGIAMALAEAKALAIAIDTPEALVVGADQVLSAEGRRWHKPSGLTEARDQLLALSGKTHALETAVAVARGGAIAWRYGATARMTMRKLSAAEVDAYLGEVGEKALASVGAYQIEGPGIRLFEAIDGDYFAILGLPLLPLLQFLHEAGAVRWRTRR
jgi:nucleoside triphosphate pyrophosphatase